MIKLDRGDSGDIYVNPKHVMSVEPDGIYCWIYLANNRSHLIRETAEKVASMLQAKES